MNPIETSYAGCRFRSRLEARWAVFFDKLGIEWQYEPQGYKFDGETYLPDFWLPKTKQFVEVKGAPDQLAEAVPLLRKFARAADHDGLLILGEVPKVEERHWSPIHPCFCKVNGDVVTLVGVTVGANRPVILPTLMYVGIEQITTEARYLPGVKPSGLIRSAYTAARSARFEHGESGAA